MNKFNVSAFQTANINEKMQAPLIKDDVMYSVKENTKKCKPVFHSLSLF